MKEFLLIVQLFYGDAESHNIKIDQTILYEFKIEKLDSANGYAYKENNKWIIIIDVEFYETFKNKTQIKSLIYHELGHITLHLDHTHKIMNPKLVYGHLNKKKIKKLFELNT